MDKETLLELKQYADVMSDLSSKTFLYRKICDELKTAPTVAQQLKAEIALLLNTWDNTTKQQFLDTWVLRIKKLRQLSAV